MKYKTRHLALGAGILLPLFAGAADLDEVTIQVIDLDSERPEAVTREIDLPQGEGPESSLLPVEPGGSDAAPSAIEPPAAETVPDRVVPASEPRRESAGSVERSLPEPARELDRGRPDSVPAAGERSRPEPAREIERGRSGEAPGRIERAIPEVVREPERGPPAERPRAPEREVESRGAIERVREPEPAALERERGSERSREVAREREEVERNRGASARGKAHGRDK